MESRGGCRDRLAGELQVSSRRQRAAIGKENRLRTFVVTASADESFPWNFRSLCTVVSRDCGVACTGKATGSSSLSLWS